MAKGLEKSFKRIEKKYIIDKNAIDDLLNDLKEYLVEDDYPTSTITNIYFDTPDFKVIKDSIAKKNGREKIRMRSYQENPTQDSQVFLELKKKDQEGIGHKFRLVSQLGAVNKFIEHGEISDSSIDDELLIEELNTLRDRYQGLAARMFIYYDRYSLKEKHKISGQPQTKIRVTIDQNLTYRDYEVSMENGVYGNDLINEGKVIMEIKAPGEQPEWLKCILEKHGLEPISFSKYGTAYRKSQGILQ